MIIVLAPAKRLNFSSPGLRDPNSMPEFKEEATVIASKLKNLSPDGLMKLMGISAKLAYLNHDRHQEWRLADRVPEAKQALLAYEGDVYNGLQASDLTGEDLAWAQDHVRILSGLYGILRPLDLIMPYRLEFATKLKIDRYNDLYSYWNDHIFRSLHVLKEKEGSGTLVNLASAEYYKSFDAEALGFDVITPVFKEYRNGEYKFFSMFGKKARGLMTRFIIDRRIADPEQMKLFDTDGYLFNEPLSNEKEWVFTR